MNNHSSTNEGSSNAVAELYVHVHEGAEPKAIKIAPDATVEQLVRMLQAAGVAISESGDEIILWVENEEKKTKRHHKLHEYEIRHGHHIHLKRIEVAVVTTSGVWPHEGFDSVPSHQPIKVELQHAAKKLGITDISGWVAKVVGRELDVEKSYLANGLKCKVEIDYGRREGGGGNE